MACTLSLLDINFYRRLELCDPQFKAVKRLCSVCYPYTAPLLASLNALVSYRLNCRGEEYWREFADFTIDYCKSKTINTLSECVKVIIEFLSKSQCNTLFRRSKINRLLSVIRHGDVDAVYVWRLFSKNPENYRVWLSKRLNANPNAKTIVFAIKMYYYGCRACLDADLILPYSIPIPVDKRIALISYTSRVISCTHNCSNPVNTILKRPGIVRRVWSSIAELCRVPPLHLDCLLWTIGGYVSKSKHVDVNRVVEELLRHVGVEYKSKVIPIIQELLSRPL